jgi:GT2 family glycosyltransferase
VNRSDLADAVATTPAVVVHHRSYDSIAQTVQDLSEQGIKLENILVVDNSEDPERVTELEASLPPAVRVVFTDNRGYGAAVNLAIDVLARRDLTSEFVVVATHETRMRPGAVARLVEALIADPSAAVAGPTLVSSEAGGDGEFVWSKGGYLSRFGRFPRHIDHRGKYLAGSPPHAAVYRDWIDGAFAVYRLSDLIRSRFSEDFFLYMEETDLHLRLNRRGRRVVWVPNAVVWQSSGGVPPYYLARNLRLLHSRNQSSWRKIFLPFELARRVIADAVRRDTNSLRPTLRGLLTRLPTVGQTEQFESGPVIAVVNPLGGALAHYVLALTDTLAASGASVAQYRADEPSVSGEARARWVWRTWCLLWSARGETKQNNSESSVLLVWPVLGYLDVLVLRALGVRATLIVHDPRPLVRAIGYGRLSRLLASRFSHKVRVMVHSSQAREALEEDTRGFAVSVVAHPIISPRAAEAPAVGIPVVRVLGQYKRDRDLDALVDIADRFQGTVSLQIDGRGWPDVRGWEVRSRFVPENELNELIESCAVVVIPYRRFYQSGVALRCLERGTLVVGPKNSNLAEVLGADSPLLASPDGPASWSGAVAAALEMDASFAREAAGRWRERAVNDWRAWWAE